MRLGLLTVLVVAGLAALAAAATGQGGTTSTTVVVPRGQPIQIAVAVELSGLPELGQTAVRAVTMATEGANVKGFEVALNVYDAPCRIHNRVQTRRANAKVAEEVVSNPQTAAVLGHSCSFSTASALPYYEEAGIVVVSGSVTGDSFVNAEGPTVFNRTVVREDQDGEAWYATVQELPSDIAWQQDYEARWGEPPFAFGYADLYYDAANLILQRIREVSTKDARGNLVIPRAALASAVRHTTGFDGVSCTITLDAIGDRVNDPAALAACAG